MSLSEFNYDFEHKFSELHEDTYNAVESKTKMYITNRDKSDFEGFAHSITNLIEANVATVMKSYNAELMRDVIAELETLKK